jgi:hypothetical protein
MNIIPRKDWKSADCSMEEASLRQTVIKVHEEEAQLLSAFQRETNLFWTLLKNPIYRNTTRKFSRDFSVH